MKGMNPSTLVAFEILNSSYKLTRGIPLLRKFKRFKKQVLLSIDTVRDTSMTRSRHHLKRATK